MKFNFKFKKDNKDNVKIKSSNIFDDFVDDSSLLEEVDKIKKDRSKWVFYYLNKIWSFFQVIFWLLIIISSTLYWYMYVQNNTNINNNSLMDPVCKLFLADIDIWTQGCSSLIYVKNDIWNKTDLIKITQSRNILFVLEKLYEIENFTKTKDIIFLSDKSISKLKVLKILEEFDNLKVSFDRVDKEKIKCGWISIDWEKDILSLKCEAYSAWYEKNIKWFDWTNKSPLKWTSISIANSFLNYISKQSNIFSIIDRQKKFISNEIIWTNTDFTQKTEFSLDLKYNIK